MSVEEMNFQNIFLLGERDELGIPECQLDLNGFLGQISDYPVEYQEPRAVIGAGN